MTRATTGHRGRWWGLPATAPAVFLLVVSAVMAGCGGTDDDTAAPPPPPRPSATTAPAAEPVSPAPSRTSGWQRLAATPRLAADPVGIVIPAIDIESEIVPVGSEDGVLEVPPDPRVVGWWSDGARPGGGAGAVVLDAHLDSRTFGKGPFTRATDLEVGDTATVRDADGDAHAYVVSDVETYVKARLPYEELFAQDGVERVVLVTCGGTYRPGQGGWDSNIVVTFERA